MTGAAPVPEAVSRHAPEAAAHLADAQRLAAAVDPVLVELARLRLDRLLGARPGAGVPDAALPDAAVPATKVAALDEWPTSPAFTAVERACLGLAEQFALDVSGVADADVAPVLEALGPAGLYGFVQALWVLDMSRRLACCLRVALPEERS